MLHLKLGKKILTLLVLILVMIPTTAFSQESFVEDDGVIELSLEDAIKLAEENNQQIKLSQLGLEKAELARDQYKFQDKKIKDLEEELGKDIKDFESTYNMDLLDKRTQNVLKLAEAGIDVTKRSIRFGVEAAYYSALSAKDRVQIAEASLERQKDMLKIAQAKFNVGTAAKKDVLDATVQLASAQAELAGAKAQEEKAYNNLKKLLNLPMDTAIELTDTFEYEPEELDKSLDEYISEAMEKRIDIMSARGDFEYAELDFELTSKVYPSNTFKYKEKEYAMEEARIKLADTLSSAEAEIRGIWLDYETAKANISVLDKSLEMAEESLRLAKLNYEAGLIRRVDVAAAEEGLKQVQLQRAAAIYNYNLSKLKLKNAVYFSVSGDAGFSN